MDKESERYNLCLEAAKNEIDRQGIHNYLDLDFDLCLVIRAVLREADRFSRNNITGDLYKNYGEL